MTMDCALLEREHSGLPLASAPAEKPATVPCEQNCGDLDDLVALVADQCRYHQMLAILHMPGKRPQILGSSGLARNDDAWAALATSDVARMKERLGSNPTCSNGVVPSGDKHDCAFFAVGGGFVTFTGAPADEDGASRARLASLQPLIAAYLDQWLLAQNTKARLESLSQAVECSGTAIIMLGDGGRIIHANTAAENILAAGDGLRRSGNRLASADLSVTLRLQAAIEHFHSEIPQVRKLHPVLAIPRSRRRSLTVALAAAQPGMSVVKDAVRAIAYVFDPEQDVTAIIEPVCQLYGFSPSQTRLTCALVAGDSLVEAAKKAGIKTETARSYLKQIFAKSETNRQSELVQLMLKSSIRLFSRGRAQAFV